MENNLQQTRPNLKFLLKHPAHFIALGAGSGLCPIAPGTAGTLFAWISFYGVAWALSVVGLTLILWPIIIVLSFIIGLWACRITAHDMRSQDPGAIVWDEVVAFWLVLYSLYFIPSTTFAHQAFAFFAFRFFDMLKKGPVLWADQHFKGSGYKNAFGIMIDDIVAALFAIIVIFIAHFSLTIYA